MEEVKRELDLKDELREKTLRLTREVVRLSGDAIKALHRGDYEKARKKLEAAGVRVREIRGLLPEHGDIYFTGYVQTANQEFVEAILLHSYLSEGTIPSPAELGVPATDYALGVGDFIGELRRRFLLTLMDGRVDDASVIFEFMEAVYNELMGLDYPKGLVNVRQKQDQARRVVERTLEDLTRAKLEDKLEGQIRNAMGRLGL